MKYLGSVTIRQGACQQRLHTLLAELQAMNCLAKLDRRHGRVNLAVPADLYCWIRAGGLAGLLQAYRDTIKGFPCFHEVAERPQ